MEKLKTVNIKGKDYVEVAERIRYFRQTTVGWAIETEILSNDGGLCIMKATVKDESGRILSTGHAYEREGSSNINKGSYIENCETSAVGRALGILGIGIYAGVASAEEVINTAEYITQEQLEEIKSLLAETKSDTVKFAKFMGVEFPDEIQAKDYTKAIEALKAKRGAK